VSDERGLAVELDRALAGEDAGSEARELAALLVAVAAPARFDVPEGELERRLAAVRPTRRARRRGPPATFALAAVAALAAAVAWFAHTPGSDVQARAARALDAHFFVLEEVRSNGRGLFPTTDVSGFVDGRTGRAHLRLSTATGFAAETLVRADGRVERWIAGTGTIVLAPSCAALPGGCEEVLDPLTLYLRTIEDGDATTERVGDAYILTIHGAHVDERVVISRHTYLPRRIDWLENGRLVSTARFLALERQTVPVSPDTWSLDPHANAHVVQIDAGGRPVRVLAIHPAQIRPGVRWLGPSYGGYRARVSDVTLTGGRATRIAYGPLVVWDYRAAVPPAVLQARNAPAKVFAIPGGIVHAYYGLGDTVVADASFGLESAAVVSTEGRKVDAVRAVQRLRFAR
jgi:hypothetical protein